MGFKVTIAPQDNDGTVIGAPVTLCDSPSELAVHGIQLNGRPILQVVDFPRALFPRVFDRGNRRVTITFGTFRNKGFDNVPFTGPAQSFAFSFDMCAFEEILPHFGFVTIEASDSTASVIRYLDRCGLEQIGLEKINGAGLWCAYQLIAGKPLNAAPVGNQS